MTLHPSQHWKAPQVNLYSRAMQQKVAELPTHTLASWLGQARRGYLMDLCLPSLLNESEFFGAAYSSLELAVGRVRAREAFYTLMAVEQERRAGGMVG